MKQSTFIAAFCLLIAIAGCTPVRFYSDRSLKDETGLRYYSIKPYLQVEREPAGRNIVKSEVIYLPDLSSPQYMMVKDGPGSRKVEVKLKDGTITELGIATDPQTAESIEALASIIDKSAEAVHDVSALKGMPQAGTQNVVELYEFIMTTEGTRLKKIEF